MDGEIEQRFKAYFEQYDELEFKAYLERLQSALDKIDWESLTGPNLPYIPKRDVDHS